MYNIYTQIFSSFFKKFFSCVQMSFAFNVMASSFIDTNVIDETSLPLPGWQFYHITSLEVFWMTYFYQGIFFFLICTSMVAYQSVFSTLVLLICAEANIMKQRLICLTELRKELRFKALVMIVNQHISIYR